jgi:hypothetical protein
MPFGLLLLLPSALLPLLLLLLGAFLLLFFAVGFTCTATAQLNVRLSCSRNAFFRRAF